jgi:XTP/dITP diphosphohydrolase
MSVIMKIVFATNNQHKVHEISHLLDSDIQVLSLKDLNISDDIPETHETLTENAVEKAMYVYKKFGYTCFADDTGLEIEALDGRPGVYSARYAGPECKFSDNVDKVLKEMNKSLNRKAAFRTIIAYVEDGKVLTFEGHIDGTILNEKRGNEGFGYDPIFLPNGYNQTFAEMNLDIKNKISHRAIALNKFIHFLKTR